MSDRVLLTIQPNSNRIAWRVLGLALVICFLLWGFFTLDSDTVLHRRAIGAGYAWFLKILLVLLTAQWLRVGYYFLRNGLLDLTAQFLEDRLVIESSRTKSEFKYEDMASISIRSGDHLAIGKGLLALIEFSDFRCFDKSGKRLTPIGAGCGSGVPYSEGKAIVEQICERYPHLEIREPKF